MPDILAHQSSDYVRIEKAIAFIEDNFRAQPRLDEIARSVHLSPFHFERLFKRWAGVSPKRFLQHLTVEYTKDMISKTSLQETSFMAGLSGPGRLHDLYVTIKAMTPGEFKRQGAGLDIAYGFCPTPFGECLLATTERGICHLAFVVCEGRARALDDLAGQWPAARLTEKPEDTDSLVLDIFSPDRTGRKPFHLHIRGTNFQINVWKALLAIPEGRLVSYRDVAALLGRPTACRAVGAAVAVNPVGYLIPCHRVITSSGRAHAYRWGTLRKKALIAWEACKAP